MGRKPQHRFHGDPERFEVVAGFIHDRYGASVRYIADVAGGQGMPCRILRKKYNYECEVVDPRGWTLKGVPGRTADAAISGPKKSWGGTSWSRPSRTITVSTGCRSSG